MEGLAVALGVGPDAVNAAHLEAIAAVLGVEDGVDIDGFSALLSGRDVLQLRLQPKGIGELVLRIDHMGLDDADLPAAVGQIQKSLISQLKLALVGVGLGVPVGKQIGLSQWRIWLHTELSRRHHGSQEGLRRSLG